MGTHRKQIRQAAVHVLTNGGAQPYPTGAGAMVFDSKGDELVNFQGQQQLPSILVYTDVEIGKPHISQNAWPFEFVCELVLEIALGSNMYDTQTSAELEEKLDDIEQQIRDTLFCPVVNGKPNQGAINFKKMYSKVTEYKSLRMGNNKNNQRLAMRGIVIDLCYSEQSCHDITKAFPEFKGFSMRAVSGDPALDVVTSDPMQ